LAQLRGDLILVVIRISIWIQDRIEGFIAGYVEHLLITMLPPGKHNGRNSPSVGALCMPS